MNPIGVLYFFILLLNKSLFNFVNSLDNDLNLYVFLKHLDAGVLSRLLAFKNYISGNEYELRPKFGKAYVYHGKGVTPWTLRLGMYGYGIVALGIRGDGNCMFYSISTALRINNVTSKKLVEWVNPDLPPAVKIAIMGILEGEEYISPMNLKRIIQIRFFGMDPYDQDSVELFNEEEFKELLERYSIFQEYNENGKLTVDDGTMVENVDIKKYYNRLLNEPDKIKVIRELYDEIDGKLYARHGDSIDKNNLEYIFQMRLIFFNKKTTLINCGLLDFNFNPKWIIPILYDDGSHYDIAGIYELGTTDLKDVKTLYSISEMPIPILMMIAEDCNLCRN